MATKNDVLAALQQHLAEHGLAPSMEALAVTLGSTPGAVRQHLKVAREEGLVTWEPRDFTTLRMCGGSSKPARKPRAPKQATVAPSAVSEDDLEASTTVTFSPAEIEQLAALADALTAIVATLRSSPVNGKDGAYLMRLLAKVHGG